MKWSSKINRPPWRTLAAGTGLLVLLAIGYFLWSPGMDVRDGRHDLGQNGIWISHGWLADDDWFVKNERTNQLGQYRDASNIRALAERFRTHNITDVFPHVCPAEVDGRLPPVDPKQVEIFLDEFAGFRVMPWIGGVNGSQVRAWVPRWRTTFVRSAVEMLSAHPRFAGVHLNVEPMTSGDTNFLVLLDELRLALPPGKLLSIAAYPPPMRQHPFEDVHWDEPYFREVAKRADQIAVMMYDTALRNPKFYQRIMALWTQEVLSWSENTPVLLGVPTYNDIGVEYHHPHVENLTNALKGIHRGLFRRELPSNYQGIAIYCDWETDASEWQYLRDHFLKP